MPNKVSQSQRICCKQSYQGVSACKNEVYTGKILNALSLNLSKGRYHALEMDQGLSSQQEAPARALGDNSQCDDINNRKYEAKACY